MKSFNQETVGQPQGQNAEQPPLRIAIVGAGIAGLTAAVGVLRAQREENANVTLDIYEAAPEFKEIGAGLYFGYNAQVALNLIGAGQAYRNVANEVDPDRWFDVTTGLNGHPKLGQNIGTVSGKRAGTGGLHRADFLDQLAKMVPREVSHFDHRCVSYNPTASGITLTFTNGKTVEADVVIASDGIRSPIREQIYLRKGLDVESQKAHYSEWTVWRGFIPRERFDAIMGKDYPLKMMHMGKDKHLTHYPLRQGAIINVVAYVRDRPHAKLEGRTGPWSEPRPQSELLAEFEDYTGPCRDLLKEIPNPSMWGVFELPVIKQWTDERIALIGDACHGMTPHQGAGSGQAIEDALFLTSLLTSPSTYSHASLAGRREAVQRALDVYVHYRQARATKVQLTSREAGRMYDFDGPDGDDIEKVYEGMKNRMQWIWYYDTKAELEKALGELKPEKVEKDQEWKADGVTEHLPSAPQVEARL